MYKCLNRIVVTLITCYIDVTFDIVNIEIHIQN